MLKRIKNNFNKIKKQEVLKDVKLKNLQKSIDNYEFKRGTLGSYINMLNDSEKSYFDFRKEFVEEIFCVEDGDIQKIDLSTFKREKVLTFREDMNNYCEFKSVSEENTVKIMNVFNTVLWIIVLTLMASCISGIISGFLTKTTLLMFIASVALVIGIATAIVSLAIDYITKKCFSKWNIWSLFASTVFCVVYIFIFNYIYIGEINEVILKNMKEYNEIMKNLLSDSTIYIAFMTIIVVYVVLMIGFSIKRAYVNPKNMIELYYKTCIAIIDECLNDIDTISADSVTKNIDNKGTESKKTEKVITTTITTIKINKENNTKIKKTVTTIETLN